MDRALALVCNGTLKPGDMAVLWCICSGLDSQSSETVLRYETIAEKCGVSRSATVRAVKSLKDTGLLELRERFYK